MVDKRMGLVGEDFSDFLGCGMSNRGVATFWARMSIRVIEVLQHLAPTLGAIMYQIEVQVEKPVTSCTRYC
jgi:hypothetical protein